GDDEENHERWWAGKRWRGRSAAAAGLEGGLELLHGVVDDEPGRRPLHEARQRKGDADGQGVVQSGARSLGVEAVGAVEAGEVVGLLQRPGEAGRGVAVVVVQGVADGLAEGRDPVPDQDAATVFVAV